jgi:hypothetical protein
MISRILKYNIKLLTTESNKHRNGELEMAHDVFISHSEKNRNIATAICSALETMKIRCWMAPRDIRPGEKFGGAIVNAIHDSKIMIVVFSADSNMSEHVVREVERAVHSKLIIIPFKIEDIKPTPEMEYFLATSHWLDAVSKPMEDNIKTLAEAVREILNIAVELPQEEEVTKEEDISVRRKKPKWLIAGVIAFCAITACAALVIILLNGTSKQQVNNSTNLPTYISGNASASAYHSGETAEMPPAYTDSSLSGSVPAETEQGTESLNTNSLPEVNEADKTIKVKSIASVTLNNGETFYAASPYIIYSSDNGLLMDCAYITKLPVIDKLNPQNKEYIAIKDIKELQVKSNEKNDDPVITVTDLHNKKEDVTIEKGRLRFLTDIGRRDVELSNITKIDFKPDSSKTLILETALIENKQGEKIFSPIDAVLVVKSDSGYAGPYAFANDIIELDPGIDIPVEYLKSIQIGDNRKISGNLIDGRAITGSMSYTGVTLVGISELSNISLNISDVKSITFYRKTNGISEMQANVHLNSNQTESILARTLQIDNGDWDSGINVENYRTVYFLEISSLKMEESANSTSEPKFDIQLWNGNTITGIKFYNKLIGISPEGEFVRIPVNSITSIDFSSSSKPIPQSPKAEITLDKDHLMELEDKPIYAPAETIQLFNSTGYGAYSSDSLKLTNGVEISFSDIKSITFGTLGDNGYEVHIEKKDGNAIDSFFDYSGSVGGLSEYGHFMIELYRISKIKFYW